MHSEDNLKQKWLNYIDARLIAVNACMAYPGYEAAAIRKLKEATHTIRSSIYKKTLIKRTLSWKEYRRLRSDYRKTYAAMGELRRKTGKWACACAVTPFWTSLVYCIHNKMLKKLSRPAS